MACYVIVEGGLVRAVYDEDGAVYGWEVIDFDTEGDADAEEATNGQAREIVADLPGSELARDLASYLPDELAKTE